MVWSGRMNCVGGGGGGSGGGGATEGGASADSVATSQGSTNQNVAGYGHVGLVADVWGAGLVV